MPTSLQLGSRALRLINALASGQSLPAEETSDMLEAMNAALDSWRIRRLFVYQIKQEAFTWPIGQASRTIGGVTADGVLASEGNFTTVRPDRIESAFVRDSNNQDYPLTLYTQREQYDAVPVKSTQSTLPQYLFYDPAYPFGVLYMKSVPSSAITLLLNSWQQLQTFADTATNLALPPGYENAIVFNLAVDLAPEYGKEPSPTVAKRAVEYAAAVKSNNVPLMVAQLDPGIANAGRIGRRGGYNIFSDS